MPWVQNGGYTGGAANRNPGEAIAGALGTIFSGPDPKTQMEAAVLGAQLRKYNSEAGLNEDELYAKQHGLGDLFSSEGFYDANGNIKDPGSVISMALRGGFDDPGKSIFRPLMAMTGDGTQMRRGLVSAGQMPNVNTALSMDESNQISARDARESMSEALAKQGLANEGSLAVQHLKNAGDMDQKNALISLLGGGNGGLGDMLNPNPQQDFPIGGMSLPGEAPTGTLPTMDYEDVANKLGIIGAATGDTKLLNTASIIADRADRQNTRDENRIDKQLMNYAKQTDDLAPLLESTRDLYTNMNSYGPEADLPGFGATGLVPSMFISPQGKKLRQDVAAVGNAVIKARSGQAVSAQEAERLANELGYTIQGGVWNPYSYKSDEELRIGLGNVMRQLNTRMKNLGTVLSPDALQEYGARGGATPPDFFNQEMLRYGLPASGDAGAGMPQMAIDEGVSPEEWKYMTPDERALFGG